MAIEILENTLLKLLVRRGTDLDRRKIILATGELGYATDTEALYIGNGVNAGGILVGNKWRGSRADLTTIAGAVTGDYVYDTSTNTLNVLIAGSGSNASDWYTVSDQISAGDGTINFSANNSITVGTLSAGNFSTDALGSSIELDGSNRIALSGTVKIDQVTLRDTAITSYLTLPPRLKINSVGYQFPSTTPGPNSYLGSNASGNLSWSSPQQFFTAVAPTTASVIPVGTIVPFVSGALEVPWGWLQCDGQAVNRFTYTDLLSVIWTNYGAGDGSTTFNVPNLRNKLLYGSPVDPAINSTLMGVTTGVANTHGSLLSATGMNYIIKSIGGVTNPTLTVRKNLSAFINGVDKTGVAFNPLSGEIVIERPAPGMQIFDLGGGGANTDGSYSFTIPDGVTYMKYYVTGSGANGGVNTGGAAATVIGNISAGAGTEFTVYVARAPTGGSGGKGCGSCICSAAGNLAISNGGCYCAIPSPTEPGIAGTSGGPGPGSFYPDQPEILNGHVFLGGAGGIDPNVGGRQSGTPGSASYWGAAPAPGAGTGSKYNEPTSNASDGFVMFEWN